MAGTNLFNNFGFPMQNNSFYGGNTSWLTSPNQGFNFMGNQGQNQLPSFGSPAANQGFNWQGLGQGINTGLGALSTLGNLYGAFQSNKLARDSFNFTKGVTNTNLNNQIQSYNTALEDRARSRAAVEGQSPQETQDWIDRNRLTRSGG